MGEKGLAARAFAVVLVVALVPGCAAVTLVPQVSLGPSSSTIRARTDVEAFTVASQQFDADLLPLDAAANVRDAVIGDFAKNRVFSEIGADVATPDLLLEGEVRKFYGRYGTTTVGWLSVLTLWVVAYTGIPLNYSEGAVDLQVTITRPDGSVLGQYPGRSAFDTTYTIQDDLSAGLSNVTEAALNQAFAESLQQIRDQILRDADRLSTR